jgi:hypothetical protein
MAIVPAGKQFSYGDERLYIAARAGDVNGDVEAWLVQLVGARVSVRMSIDFSRIKVTLEAFAPVCKYSRVIMESDFASAIGGCASCAVCSDSAMGL